MKVGLKISHKNFSKEHTLSINDSVRLGRSSSCELMIDDERISSKHCRLEFKWDRLEINDLDSKNGTYLNGIRIDSAEVFVGDVIKIGKTTIKIEKEDADTQALSALSFQGATKERLSHPLKADFTGVRTFQQPVSDKPALPKNINPDDAKSREIELRKSMKSKLKVSKQEIRSLNKKEAGVSVVLDVLIAATFLGVPFLVLQYLVPASAQQIQKFNYLIILESVMLAILYFLNFKLSKFTLGEKLSGIERLYLEQ